MGDHQLNWISGAELETQEVEEFWELVLGEEWTEVIKTYEEDSRFHKIDIKGRGTALHVAVSNGCKTEVESLLNAIIKCDRNSLSIMNEIGATPLHLAASRGYTDICEIIIGKGERSYLIKEKNDAGETPLFWAVSAYKIPAFVYLRQFHPLDLNIALDNNNTSILHIAIEREMFDLAIIIMHYYDGLISMKDEYDMTPLKVLATRTSAFKSGSRLSWWKGVFYYCFNISSHDAITTLESLPKKVLFEENTKNEKGDYRLEIYDVEELERAYETRNSLAQSCLKIQKFVFRWPILSLLDLEAIKTIKKNHTYGGQILHEFMRKPIGSYIGGGYKPVGDEEMETIFLQYPMDPKLKTEGGDTSTQEIEENEKKKDSANTDGKDTTFFSVAESDIEEIMKELNSKVPITSDKKELSLVAMNIKKDGKSDVKNTAYLIAASHGIVEMMEQLTSKIKSVINDTNSNNENAFLLAVINRQPHVIQWLKKNLDKDVIDHLILQIDKNDNTVLHLAAYTSFQRENNWKIAGAAMKMMWDIKWYKYIKGLVPEHFNNIGNKEGKTPSEIFKEQHKDLLQNSVDWLKETAESCSVVAALIAGVSFATSGSVPGGNKPTGEPTLAGQPAFEGFAISSLIGLYFSVTALIMFLAILTSRKDVEDFRRNLPMKLLFGLCSLFVSIIAMFISFCTGHFFVLTDKYTKGGILFYLYISICLPITFYGAVQFPLFIDLVKIIWKKVPPQSVKGVLL